MSEKEALTPFERLRTKLKALKASCDICGGTGRVEGSDDTYFKDCPGCTQKLHNFEKCMNANIPEEILEIKLTDIQPNLTPNCYKNFSVIISKVEKLITSYQMIIYLADNMYSFGTMTLMGLVLKELAYKDYNVEHINFTELKDSCYNFGPNQDVNATRMKRYEHLKEVQILGISDFGNISDKFDCSTFLYKKIVEFLNVRRMNGLFTVIAVEKTKLDFYEKYIGSLTAMLSQYYLPFIIQCHDGKYKHTAVTKLAKEDTSLSDAFEEPEVSEKVLNLQKKIEVKDTQSEDTVLDTAFTRKGSGYDKSKK